LFQWEILKSFIVYILKTEMKRKPLVITIETISYNLNAVHYLFHNWQLVDSHCRLGSNSTVTGPSTNDGKSWMNQKKIKKKSDCDNDSRNIFVIICDRDISKWWLQVSLTAHVLIEICYVFVLFVFVFCILCCQFL
jgi:hypothetical protein